MKKLLLLLLISATFAHASELPRVEKTPNGSFRLMVDGNPYLILGAQVRNSSNWSGELEKTWPLYQQLHANTAEIPIYWEVIEPQQGKFDFSSVDRTIEGARKNGLRLVLLWFATWKNGQMDYAPQWVKENPDRYPHMRDRAGDQIKVLSPIAESTRTADATAFAALMKHIKAFDSEQRTVIMMQVENEPGSLESDRDYSPEANRLFAGQVPAPLVRAMKKTPGTWAATFGPEEADEAFAAYYVATYVNTVAAAGKAEYPLPMYVNVWLRERKNFEAPGEAYPSGGATTNELDLWKSVTPSLDAIAPDNYVLDYVGYRNILKSYSRPDNPLFVPETVGGGLAARYMFYAIGEFHSLSFAPFGIDSQLPSDSTVPHVDRNSGLAANFRLLNPAVAEVARLQQSNSIKVAVEEDQITDLLLSFPKFDSVVTFGTPTLSYGGLFGTGTKNKTGRAMIAELGPDEFLICGFDSLVRFRPRRGSALR
ncbi:MAG: beta-galactosidase, partial [Granulicella sp.]